MLSSSSHLLIQACKQNPPSHPLQMSCIWKVKGCATVAVSGLHFLLLCMGNNSFKRKRKKRKKKNPSNKEVILSNKRSQAAFSKNVLDFYLCVAIVCIQEKESCLPSIHTDFYSRSGKNSHTYGFLCWFTKISVLLFHNGLDQKDAAV